MPIKAQRSYGQVVAQDLMVVMCQMLPLSSLCGPWLCQMPLLYLAMNQLPPLLLLPLLGFEKEDENRAEVWRRREWWARESETWYALAHYSTLHTCSSALFPSSFSNLRSWSKREGRDGQMEVGSRHSVPICCPRPWPQRWASSDLTYFRAWNKSDHK